MKSPRFGLFLLIFILHSQNVLGSFSYLGCYSSSAFSGTGTSYTYQSEGYCTNQCEGYAYAAMINGKNCLCSNTKPSSDQVDDSNCDTSCSGFPSDTCGGGNDYFSVYDDESLVSSSSSDSSSSSSDSISSSSSSSSSSPSSSSSSISSSSFASSSSFSSSSISFSSSSTTSQSTTTLSSSSTTSTTSSTTPTTSSTSSTPTPTTSSTSSSKDVVFSSSLATPSTIETTSLSLSTNDGKTITSAVIIKTTQSYSNIYVTYTASATETAIALPNKKNDKTNNSLSKGATAGIAVGVITAVLLFLAVLYYIWRQRKKSLELKKAQNAAIAATVVANNRSSKYPEKKRFSNLHNDLEDDENDEILPVIGSTGDGNGSNSASTFSRNPSSKFNFNDGLGIRMNSPPLPNQTTPGGHQKQISGTTLNDSTISRQSYDEDFSNGINEADEYYDEKDGFFFTNPAEVLNNTANNAGGGLRIANPDRNSVISDNSGLLNIPAPTNPHKTHMYSSSSVGNKSDDDLFKDRVLTDDDDDDDNDN